MAVLVIVMRMKAKAATVVKGDSGGVLGQSGCKERGTKDQQSFIRTPVFEQVTVGFLQHHSNLHFVLIDILFDGIGISLVIGFVKTQRGIHFSARELVTVDCSCYTLW